MNSFVRQPQFAGAFYPEDPQILTKMIGEFLHQATIEKIKSKPRALVVPHAGYVYSGPVAAYGFKAIENLDYERIILLGPSHHFGFEGLIFSPNGYWKTPLGQVESLNYDPVSLEIHEPEHCLEVELPFLQSVLKTFKIIPCLTGEGEIKKLAQVIIGILNDKTLLLVSSDLSHYHSYNEAQKLDKVTIDAILDKDNARLEKFGEACGKIGLEILIEIARKKNWQPKLLKALNSGDITGEKKQVVGYASIIFL